MYNTRNFNFIVLVFLVGVLLISCSSKQKKFSDVFRYNESKGISTLDPAFARSQTIIWPVNQLFNGLVQFDAKMNIIPCIAKDWQVTIDGTLYTFHLRSDVLFHRDKCFQLTDNRTVTAHDFVFSFNRIMNPGVASPGAWVFQYLDKEFGNNGCRAINDSTLQIKLSKAFPPFLGILGMKYCSVVPYEAIEEYGRNFGSHPVGTGPFYLKYWKQGEGLVMRRNTEYFEVDSQGVRLPYLEAVNVSFITDKQSEFMEFMLGNIDFISGIHAQYKDALLNRNGELNKKHSDKIFLQKGAYLNTEYLGFNMDSANFKVIPKPVRLALNYCFDRKQMITYLRNNMATAALNGIVPPPLDKDYPAPVKGYEFNLSKSKKVLNDAGYSSGFPDPVILFTTSDYVDICEYIQHQAAELNINIEIELGTGASFRNRISSGNAMFFRGSWIADYPDPENYLSLFYSGNKSPNGPNYTRYSNKQVDSMYEVALQTVDMIEKNTLYYKIEQEIMNDAPIIPLYYDNVIRFVRSNVEGFSVNPMNLLELKTVRKSN